MAASGCRPAVSSVAASQPGLPAPCVRAGRLQPLAISRSTFREDPLGGSDGVGTVARRDDLPTLSFATATEWEEWLEREHEHARGLWLTLAKKGAGIAGISYSEALDVA